MGQEEVFLRTSESIIGVNNEKIGVAVGIIEELPDEKDDY